MSQPDARYRAMADPSRRHVLRILDDAADPVTLGALAEKLDLHVNTVRGHLDVLENAGLVERTTVRRSTPGRPRVAFRTTAPENREPMSDGYRLLADALAASIEATNAVPATAARDAGREWGRSLAADALAAGASDPMRVVMGALSELGFSPEERRGETGTEIRLHDCPFRSLAKARTDVVCSVHEGLLSGILEEMGSDLAVDDLRPFVEPSLCSARLSRH